MKKLALLSMLVMAFPLTAAKDTVMAAKVNALTARVETLEKQIETLKKTACKCKHEKTDVVKSAPMQSVAKSMPVKSAPKMVTKPMMKK